MVLKCALGVVYAITVCIVNSRFAMHVYIRTYLEYTSCTYIVFIAYAEHANSRGKCLWLTVNQEFTAGLGLGREKYYVAAAARKVFQTRAQLNCENFERERASKKNSQCSCLHIYPRRVQILATPCTRVVHVYYTNTPYTVFCVVQLILERGGVSPTPQRVSNIFQGVLLNYSQRLSDVSARACVCVFFYIGNF